MARSDDFATQASVCRKIQPMNISRSATVRFTNTAVTLFASKQSLMFWVSKTADLPRRNSACSARAVDIDDGFDTVVDKPFEDLMGTQSKEIGKLLLEFSSGLEDFEIVTTRALLQALGILKRCEQKERKPRNQYFKAALVRMISSSSRHTESGRGALELSDNS